MKSVDFKALAVVFKYSSLAIHETVEHKRLLYRKGKCEKAVTQAWEKAKKQNASNQDLELEYFAYNLQQVFKTKTA